MRTVLADLRYALRLTLRDRGFSAVVVAVVALGIGLNTAIFTVVNAVLLTPLPFDRPERLVRLYQSQPQRNLAFFSVAAPDFLEWKEHNRSFQSIGAFTPPQSVGLTSTSEPTQVLSARVGRDIFSLLGVQPARGRAFTEDEERVGARVAVVSHEFWTNRLGSTADAVGSEIALDGDRFAIVGVMPPRFAIPGSPAQVWTTLRFRPAELRRGFRFLRVLARLRPGVAPPAARVEMGELARTQALQYPGTNDRWSASVRTLNDLLIGDDFQRSVTMLAAAVSFVLLIACANIANLLLARSAARTREMATRAALGASRARVLRLLLTESFVLAAIGGVLGLLVALWGVDVLKWLNPGNIPRLADIHADGRVLAFTAVVTIVTGLLFGLLPALQTSRTDLSAALNGARAAAGPVRRHMRSALVASELALALVLLAGAGLMIKSFARLRDVPLGFETDRVVAMAVPLAPSRYPGPEPVGRFHDALLARVSALGGVEAVGETSLAPLNSLNSAVTFRRQGRPPADEVAAAPDADVRIATAGYFRAMNIPLLRGRLFTAEDRAGAERVVLMSDTAARRYWPGADPVGQRIEMGDPPSVEVLRIVGVVGDVRHFSPEDPLRPVMYFHHAQRLSAGTMWLVVRTAGDPSAIAPSLRAAVWSLDSQQAVGTVITMREAVGRAYAQRRFSMVLLTVFAALALGLAAVGVYGVMSYTVSLRKREIGVRMALGARSADVLRLVLRDGLALAVAGVAAGVLLGLWLMGLAGSVFFQVEPHDAATFLSVAALLLLVAAAACYLPARRATAADPCVALRAE